MNRLLGNSFRILGVVVVLVAVVAALCIWHGTRAKAAPANLTKASIMENLKAKPYCNQLLGATTLKGTEGVVKHYSQAFLEVDTTDGTVAKVRQIYFMVVDEGKPTEAAYYDAQSVPTAEVDLVVASKLATVIKVP
jgi:hypothetical protein